jgi:hypothetical protein
VSYIPAWLLLVVLIVLVLGGAMLVQKYVRRRFPALTGDEHNDLTKFTYGFIGFVYAFFIGFVVSSMWGSDQHRRRKRTRRKARQRSKWPELQSCSTRPTETASSRAC